MKARKIEDQSLSLSFVSLATLLNLSGRQLPPRYKIQSSMSLLTGQSWPSLGNVASAINCHLM